MKAIVTGCLGQDGSYMCDLLRRKRYEVLNVYRHNIHLLKTWIKDFQPDEIYNFAGVSDVITPFDGIKEIMDVNLGIPVEILRTIAAYSPKTKFFQASSCLSLEPIYPYGVAKKAADDMISVFRSEYKIYACSGIFFPHESPRRKDHFFSKKVINAALNRKKIEVGSLDAVRDYGFAPDYMEAAWLMLQQKEPKDYQICTGHLTTLRDFVKMVFKEADLDYKKYVFEDETKVRNEKVLIGNEFPILHDLGWRAKHSVKDLIKIMLHERTVLAR
jgi:GDPmannose 4,6-dehydratase